MSAFEFFFSFYGLLLGFSVAELTGGLARMIQRRREIRFGSLTLLLALFVAVDITTFWNQAWFLFRNAPFNLSLLVFGLTVAGTFYVAASLTFPRDFKPGASLDDHFWANRRIVLLCVLGANLIVVALFLTLTIGTGELARLKLGPVFWGGLVVFNGGVLTAALANRRSVVSGALYVLLAYSGLQIGRTAAALGEAGGWSLLNAA